MTTAASSQFTQHRNFDALRREFFAGRAVDTDAQSVIFALFRAQAQVFSAMERDALRPLGLTHAGFTLLITLWMLGPLETRELAPILGISKPSIVSAVNTLERRRLVRRTRSTEDRRLVTVTLTTAGEKLVERGQAATHVYERRFANTLSRNEQRMLAQLLDRLATEAQEANKAAATRPQDRRST
jgi:MarR family 2-MHQ and catechol resistance regulon transcriptional repressor